MGVVSLSAVKRQTDPANLSWDTNFGKIPDGKNKMELRPAGYPDLWFSE